ncbi:STAS domain-containing protein [Saccharothrix sp. NPDC042600]|uniref:STAS domain-containing protein n=1 Tax=Saccharothrix sp. NPDC042600 TaxID=3154492 RepID=UPI0033E05DFD|nr:hypothetical protein GCM10017745_45800 [Saccharothrix mutabilis subsp. capreolus]
METLPDGQVVVLHVAGEVDAATVTLVEHGVGEALTEAAAAGAVLLVADVDQVLFCASAGITLLFHAQRRARQHGLEFAVAARPDSSVRKVLAVTQADRVLSVRDSLDHALLAPD